MVDVYGATEDVVVPANDSADRQCLLINPLSWPHCLYVDCLLSAKFDKVVAICIDSIVTETVIGESADYPC